MEYDPEQVLTAWKTFISQGIILADKVRPEIARSWQRCKTQGLDPWSVDFPKPSEELLHKKKEEYKNSLKVATPVLQYLMVLYNSNISISDRDGFIFELITPLDYYPRTLGTTVTEDKVGTGNVPLALIEKQPVRVDGYEHYRVISQNYSGVSVPILDNTGVVSGIININNPFNNLPPSALKSCTEAASIMNQLLYSGKNSFRLFATANLFKSLIDHFEKAVIVLDHDGMILTANTLGEELVGSYQDMPYASQSFSAYLCDKNILGSLLDCSSNRKETDIIEFKPLKGRQRITAHLLNRKEINLPNGLIHLVLVLETEKKDTEDLPKQNWRQNTPAVDYIGQSEAWKKVDDMVHKIAKHKTNVLLLGETGTGKEVVARAIHRLSGRAGRFVALNCSSIPRDLLASELFGYEGGSFTGARAGGSIGKFEWASGGTLFLDEIGEMPIDMQASLLRALQEKSITKIGSNKSQKIDTQIVAATNRDMPTMIKEGLFRLDLYYRLSVFEIKLPLLKERREDIPLLAEHFNKELSSSLNINYVPLSTEVINALTNYHWPGNVRELKNMLEKMLILADGKPITLDILPEHVRNPKPDLADRFNYQQTQETMCNVEPEQQAGKSNEKEKICKLLEEHKGNISQVAKELGISRNTLYKKIIKLGIKMTFYSSK